MAWSPGPWYEPGVLAGLIGSLALTAAVQGKEFRSPAGFSLRLPPGFAVDESLPAGPSRAAAFATSGEEGRLEGTFSDLAAGGRSDIFVSEVPGPVVEGAFAEERLGAMALDQLQDQLGSRVTLEWIDRVPAGDQKAVELAVRFSLDGEDRVAQIAFIPAGPRRHFVVAASLPSADFASHGPRIEAAIASFRLLTPRPPLLSGAEAGALAGGALGLAVALVARRRKRAKTG